ncbi:MAG: hypothetical protein AAF671_06360 [Pseudomonadota bacterium]
MSSSSESRQSVRVRHEKLRGRLADALDGLGLEAEEAASTTIAQRRRRRGLSSNRIQTLQFVERDGIVMLREGRRRIAQGRRFFRSGGADVIEEIPFERLGKNDVKAAIDRLDKKLTGRFGLYRVETIPGGSLKGRARIARLSEQVVARAPTSGKVLLFVHGTFSNTEALLEQMQANPEGRAFLTQAFARYKDVLAFNHRTLAVSPMINARELYKAFRESNAEVHIVCHSRGGLVTRCWLEAMDFQPPNKRRVVFVGSPLAGTSLAAPPNLRGMLNLLANIGGALGKGSAAVPFLAAAAGFFQVFSSVTSVVANTPVIDAAVALVPGIDAQSRVSNNRLIESFRSDPVSSGRHYFAVQSNFEPKSNRWKFWRNFRDAKTRVGNLLVDPIFDGPNDLVVDTSSMTSLADELRITGDQILDYGTSSKVHHTNYFQQDDLYPFIARALEFP